MLFLTAASGYNWYINYKSVLTASQPTKMIGRQNNSIMKLWLGAHPRRLTGLSTRAFSNEVATSGKK